MKHLFILIFLFIIQFSLSAQHLKKDGTPDMRFKENKSSSSTYYPTTTTNTSTTHVDTYQKKDGTIVQEHNRTSQNNTDKDNWSTDPNINPETGKKGYKKPK